ncbi:MAG: hypothetical protein CVV44_13635 [Spirochaetae bacterium HGW-Spirochaetae-1]|nr:MAG: hypothetical protein CVV44_13635 [Spirochaetae bacterium HGW-Spirochaetae-1]
MNKLYQIIDEKILYRYKDMSLEIRYKSRLLVVYYLVGLIVFPSHLCYMYFYVNLDIMKMIGSIPVYFIFVVIVQASLFNNKLWLSGITVLFIVLDVYAYISINHFQENDLLAFTASFISSLITILSVYVLLFFIKIIIQAAIERSENESAVNVKQYEKIKALLNSVAQTSTKLVDHSDLLTNNANSFFEVFHDQHQGLLTLLQKMEDLFLMTTLIGEQIQKVNLSIEEVTSMA